MTNDKMNKNILFVDDEKYMIEMLKVTFEVKGYKAYGATTPEDALKIFEEKKDEINLLIADQKMPQMLGTELAEKILAIKPELPVIIYTGYADEVHIEKAKKMNITVINKPIIRNLLEKIEELF